MHFISELRLVGCGIGLASGLVIFRHLKSKVNRSRGFTRARRKASKPVIKRDFSSEVTGSKNHVVHAVGLRKGP